MIFAHITPKLNSPSILSFLSMQSNISTTGSQTDPARVQDTAASASTTRWTHWWGRRASASAWPSSNSTCCCPASSRCGWTPSRCPTASVRTAPSASCTSRSPAPQERRPAPWLAPPQETTGRWAPWWTVTSAARRNWWCWAEPVPPKPTIWWLCPVRKAHRHPRPTFFLFRVTPWLVRSCDQVRVSLFKAKNMKWNSERRKKQKRKKAEDVAYRPGDGNLVGLIFFTLSPCNHLFCCVIGSAGHSVFEERLCGNGTVGAAKPTNQEPLWRLAPPSPLDCKQHGDQLHLWGGSHGLCTFLTCGYYGYMFNTAKTPKL